MGHQRPVAIGHVPGDLGHRVGRRITGQDRMTIDILLEPGKQCLFDSDIFQSRLGHEPGAIDRLCLTGANLRSGDEVADISPGEVCGLVVVG